MTTDDLVRLIEQVPCGFCLRAFRTPRGRAGHMAQKHPAEWEAEGISTGKLAARRYFAGKARERRDRDPESVRRATNEWRSRNRDHVGASRAAWRSSNEEHRRAYQRSWTQANREHVLEYAMERRLTGKASTQSVEARRQSRRRASLRDRLTGAGMARRAVAKALASGSLVKGPCDVCGSDRTEGHHYLGYSPEHRLDVRWLCKEHHTEAHRPEGVARRRRVEQRLRSVA